MERTRLGMIAASTAVIKGALNYRGRSSRSEFWLFCLSLLVLSLGSSFLFGFLGGLLGPQFYENKIVQVIFVPLLLLALFYYVLGLISIIALQVRRLHDLDKSGWWIFAFIIPLVGTLLWLFWNSSAGTHGPNRYGKEPIHYG